MTDARDDPAMREVMRHVQRAREWMYPTIDPADVIRELDAALALLRGALAEPAGAKFMDVFRETLGNESRVQFGYSDNQVRP